MQKKKIISTGKCITYNKNIESSEFVLNMRREREREKGGGGDRQTEETDFK